MLFLLTLLTLLQQERKPDMKTPIETFSNWVKNGKDEGMEKNHFESVSKMFDIIVNSKENFRLLTLVVGMDGLLGILGNTQIAKVPLE